MNMFFCKLFLLFNCIFFGSIIAKNSTSPSLLNPILQGTNDKDEAGFQRAIVTITFDDGFESQYLQAGPVLKEHEYHATFYLYTDGLNVRGHLCDEQVVNLKNDGNEIGSHSVSHPHLKTIGSSELENELIKSKLKLEILINAPVNNFAAPFGEVSPYILKKVKEYYKSNRSVVFGYNNKVNFNPYEIKVQNVENNVALHQFELWLDKAIEDKLWLVLVYHGVDLRELKESVTPTAFKQQMEAIKKRNLPVLTTSEALKEVTPQLIHTAK